MPVSNAILSRISGLPESLATSHYHRTIAYLPREVAEILSREPGLVSRAVAAFYERDALQLKACLYMQRFPPSGLAPSSSTSETPTPAGAMYSSVRMTRALYAQLLSQKFYAPKPFLKAGWMDGVEEGSLDARRRDTGMKIACGFEMLYAESARSMKGTKLDMHSSAQEGPIHSMQSQSYLRYLVALQNAGYFQGEVPGSKLYTQLERKGEEYWGRLADEKKDMGERGFAQKCDTIARQAKEEPRLQYNAELKEDSDDWLYLNQASLEDMLRARETKPTQVPDADSVDAERDGLDAMSGEGNGINENEDEDEDEKLANEQARKLQHMAEKFEDFVEGKGALEGAMLEDEMSDNESDDNGDDDDLNANIEEMVAAPASVKMTTEEKKRRMDRLVPALQDTEWGAAAAQAAKALDSSASTNSPSRMDAGKANAAQSSYQTRVHSTFHDKHDGVSDDSDSEIDGDGHEFAFGLNGELDQGEDAAQIVGDDQLEFGEGELDEFLNFTREALGLSPDQYNDIVDTRRKRGGENFSFFDFVR